MWEEHAILAPATTGADSCDIALHTGQVGLDNKASFDSLGFPPGEKRLDNA